MKKKITVSILILLICGGAILTVKFLKPKEFRSGDRRTLTRSKGDPHAPLWITEYFDYQCPACGNAHGLLEKYFEKYPGKIYLQMKFYPLPQHKFGPKAALYAECAARQDKFWKFHDLLFDNQKIWSVLPDAEPSFRSYGQQSGLDMNKCDACLTDPETEKAILDEKGKATALGIQITPTAYVNGKVCAGYQALNQALQNYFEEPSTDKAPATGQTDEKKPYPLNYH